MNESPKVEITDTPGSDKQWGKKLLYHLDGKKLVLSSKRVKWVAGISVVVIVILLLLQGLSDPPPPRSGKSANAVPSDLGAVHVRSFDVPPLASRTQSSDSSAGGKVASGASGTRSKAPKFSGPQLLNRPRLVKIPPGTMIKAILLSGASNGLVRAQAKEALIVAGERLIEEGVILVGNGESTQERLKIKFNQMVNRDGTIDSIRAQACDGEDKIVGIKGSQIGNQGAKLMAGIGLNFAGGMSMALQESEVQNGVAVKKSDMKNALLNGSATAALDQSREMMSDLKNKTPVIEVDAETEFYLMFEGE